MPPKHRGLKRQAREHATLFKGHADEGSRGARLLAVCGGRLLQLRVLLSEVHLAVGTNTNTGRLTTS